MTLSLDGPFFVPVAGRFFPGCSGGKKKQSVSSRSSEKLLFYRPKDMLNRQRIPNEIVKPESSY